MADHGFRLKVLEYHAGIKTIYDRLKLTDNSFIEQLDEEAKDNTYLAYLVGYQAGRSEISRNVLEWIKEGA